MPRYQLRFNGVPLAGDMRAGAARGLFLAAEYVLGKSKAVVPIDEGALARSGTASVDEATLTAAISYDSPYAVRQHEETTYQHAPGRQAKYLEGPLNASRAQVGQIIAAEIRRALR